MDIFGKRKKRRITDLELVVANLKREKEELKRLLELEEEKSRGEHIPGAYCEQCVNGLKITQNPFVQSCGPNYTCRLNCKCKDFAKR